MRDEVVVLGFNPKKTRIPNSIGERGRERKFGWMCDLEKYIGGDSGNNIISTTALKATHSRFDFTDLRIKAPWE